ncbi:MAG: hypothetical protein L0213_06925, partial [Candidatus Dadabacteria bacterium]|nr:hypothetical protein [Candidatus Dadabacteria bacterium]
SGWAVTFGRNQQPPRGLDGIPVIRRYSGGGVVPHGGDLTYSVVRERRAGSDNYRDIVALLTAALREIGLAGEVWDDKEVGTVGACFASLAPFDIHIMGRKLAGCAQRRKRGGILHHGSIAAGEPAPDFAASPYYNPGAVVTAEEIAGRRVGWGDVTAALAGMAPEYLGGETLIEGDYSELELLSAGESKIKFASDEWNIKAQEW